MDRAYRGFSNSWLIPWTYTCWKNGGLTARCSTNLVSHVGYDDLATHYGSVGTRYQPPFRLLPSVRSTIRRTSTGIDFWTMSLL